MRTEESTVTEVENENGEIEHGHDGFVDGFVIPGGQVEEGDTVYIPATAVNVNGQIMAKLSHVDGVPDRVVALHAAWFEDAPSAVGRPGALRWKFDGGKGAMIDMNDRIVGYYRLPATLRAEANALSEAVHDVLAESLGDDLGGAVVLRTVSQVVQAVLTTLANPPVTDVATPDPA